MSNLRFIISAIVCLVIFFNQYTHAAQIIPVTEDIEIKATISSYELNRIKIEGGKITGFRALEGDLTAVADSKKGELFINLPHKYSKKPTNLFIISDSGATFKLLLLPKNIPAEQIFLVEQSTSDQKLKIYDNYRDQLLSFYKSLYSGEPLKNYKISFKKKKSKKDKLKITKITTYTPTNKSNLHGEIYEIKNKSKTPQILEPENFYRQGVRAVKIDSLLLLNKEVTRMYIISIKG